MLTDVYLDGRYCSKKVVAIAERTAWEAARAMRAHDMEQLLPGLGIVSDLAVIWDGVSIGAASFSRYETLMLTGCSYMDQSTGMDSKLFRRCWHRQHVISVGMFKLYVMRCCLSQQLGRLPPRRRISGTSTQAIAACAY